MIVRPSLLFCQSEEPATHLNLLLRIQAINNTSIAKFSSRKRDYQFSLTLDQGRKVLRQKLCLPDEHFDCYPLSRREPDINLSYN